MPLNPFIDAKSAIAIVTIQNEMQFIEKVCEPRHSSNSVFSRQLPRRRPSFYEVDFCVDFCVDSFSWALRLVLKYEAPKLPSRSFHSNAFVFNLLHDDIRVFHVTATSSHIVESKTSGNIPSIVCTLVNSVIQREIDQKLLEIARCDGFLVLDNLFALGLFHNLLVRIDHLKGQLTHKLHRRVANKGKVC